jgi:tetraacyldisaccharide 4'-kinase
VKAPGFWWRERPGLFGRLLQPFGALYGAATMMRLRRPGWRAPCPVICLGNLTVGGSGKTPAALAIADLLRGMGERPVFLTRGYGGAARAPMLVDLARHDAALTGDEAQLLAAAAPTVVAADRAAGARIAFAAGASVIVMDDGLQNPALAKSLAIAVIDAGSGFGNGLTLPAGPLRAPPGAQAPFVDAVLLVGDGAAGERALGQLPGKTVLRAALRPDPRVAAALKGTRVLAMAGIGRPEKFVRTLRECGAEVMQTLFVGDHAPYAHAQLAEVAARAEAAGLKVATTKKDIARIGDAMPEALARLVIAVPVTLEFADDAVLGALLRKALSARAA